MIRSITIKLDHLPYKELNPNNLRRLHWSERSRVTKIARDEVAWTCKAQWHDDEPMTRARISYEFLIKGNRKHDVDNLLSACKPFQDGLIDAGVIRFDDAKHLEYGLVRAVYDTREETIITVLEID